MSPCKTHEVPEKYRPATTRSDVAEVLQPSLDLRSLLDGDLGGLALPRGPLAGPRVELRAETGGLTRVRCPHVPVLARVVSQVEQQRAAVGPAHELPAVVAHAHQVARERVEPV